MPRSLSQRSLQAFRLTVLTGSVSAAAETMGRTQPAVSRLLKELEQDVGFRLFDRVKGRLQPTSEGRLFFDEVQRSFIGLDRIASIAGEIRRGRRGTLAIASLPAAASILTRAMRLFTERRPGTTIAFHAVPSEAVVQMVLTQESDLGLVSAAVPRPGLTTERRYAIPCMCVMPPGHRLAALERVGPEDLEGEALVSFSPATCIGLQFETILEQHGVDKLTRVETHLSYLVSSLVLEGVGIGIVDSITAAAHTGRDGAARPFEPLITFEVEIVRAAEAELSGAQELFVAICDEQFASLPDVAVLR